MEVTIVCASGVSEEEIIGDGGEEKKGGKFKSKKREFSLPRHLFRVRRKRMVQYVTTVATMRDKGT